MDPKFLYWSAALVNLGVIFACGARGVRAVRAGDVGRHRAMMLSAAALVGLFLFSYVGKVFWLGKEDRSRWTSIDYAVLYTHEACITLMLAAGAVALFQAWRFRKDLDATGRLPERPLSGAALHRRAGRIASWSALGALVTAVGVWIGMWWRV